MSSLLDNRLPLPNNLVDITDEAKRDEGTGLHKVQVHSLVSILTYDAALVLLFGQVLEDVLEVDV